MADRLEDYLRRMLEGPPAPAAPPKRPEPRKEAVEAEVVEAVEALEPEHRRPLQREIEENLGSDALSSGRIGEEEPAGAETPPPKRPLAASDIAQLLRSPQRLREAIVVSEILKRPEW